MGTSKPGRAGWVARATGAGAIGAAFVAIALGALAETGRAAAPAQAVSDAGSGPDAEAMEQPATCGRPGSPPCPLQAWMRANVAGALASRDDAGLARALDRAAKLVPDPAWASWVESAEAGASAARKGDVARARASCKAFHEAWREAYRAKYRTRPVGP